MMSSIPLYIANIMKSPEKYPISFHVSFDYLGDDDKFAEISPNGWFSIENL